MAVGMFIVDAIETGREKRGVRVNSKRRLDQSHVHEVDENGSGTLSDAILVSHLANEHIRD